MQRASNAIDGFKKPNMLSAALLDQSGPSSSASDISIEGITMSVSDKTFFCNEMCVKNFNKKI